MRTLLFGTVVVLALGLPACGGGGGGASAAPTITVLGPNGGESWIAGSTQTVTWSSTGVSGNVDLDYSIDNGSTWTTLIANTANDGTASVTAPVVFTNSVRVQVSVADGNPSVAASPSDRSDADFHVGGPPNSISYTFTAGGPLDYDDVALGVFASTKSFSGTITYSLNFTKKSLPTRGPLGSFIMTFDGPPQIYYTVSIDGVTYSAPVATTSRIYVEDGFATDPQDLLILSTDDEPANPIYQFQMLFRDSVGAILTGTEIPASLPTLDNFSRPVDNATAYFALYVPGGPSNYIRAHLTSLIRVE